MAICAAGSHLGIELNRGSFPVGNVDFLNIYPMSFVEFLTASDETRSVEILHNLSEAKSLRVFDNKYSPPYRAIMSAGNLNIDTVNRVHRYPLYLASIFPLPQ